MSISICGLSKQLDSRKDKNSSVEIKFNQRSLCVQMHQYSPIGTASFCGTLKKKGFICYVILLRMKTVHFIFIVLYMMVLRDIRFSKIPLISAASGWKDSSCEAFQFLFGEGYKALYLQH